VTPKPVVAGTQTAVVVGPRGEEIFTDKYGRVKVQFHWDRDGKHDANSSCWVRVAQAWAGKRWGTSFWPRIGQEVVVAFEEGDPDRPIILGSVYNADQMPPYQSQGSDPRHANDNKVSGVKSNSTPGGKGYNELRFDDTAGKEQVYLHAQSSLDVRVGGSERETVGGSRHLTVGGQDSARNRVGDQIEKVFGDKHQHVLGEKQEWITGQALQVVGTDKASAYQVIYVYGSQWEHVRGNRVHLVGKLAVDRFMDTYHVQCPRMSLQVDPDDYLVSVQGNSTHKVKTGDYYVLAEKGKVIIFAGSDSSLVSDGVATVCGSARLFLASDKEIVLQAGASQIVLNDSGVFIDGPQILMNAGTPPAEFPPSEFSEAAIRELNEKELAGYEPFGDLRAPAGADDAKSGFASSVGAARKAPPAPSAGGTSPGRPGAQG
jgi:hypothetical protein